MKKSSLIKRYKRYINEINKEQARIIRDKNPEENFIVDRILSRKTTLLEVIEDIKNLEELK